MDKRKIKVTITDPQLAERIKAIPEQQLVELIMEDFEDFLEEKLREYETITPGGMTHVGRR